MKSRYFYLNQLGFPHIPYKTQTDNPENDWGNHSNIATDGCGLCSAVMVEHFLDKNSEYSLYDAVELSEKCGANHRAGTDYLIFAPEFAKKRGFSLEITDDPDKLREHLKNGGAAVIHCRNDRPEVYECLFTKGGHYITAVGLDEKGRAIVLDPSYKLGKYDTPQGRERIELLDDYIALCSIETLVEETYCKKPNCFYLFGKK